MKRHVISVISLLFLFCSVFALDAAASEVDQKTYFSINQPLRIPGKVVLPPGKYVMKLVDPGTRNLVRVMSADESKIYSTFFGIPRYLHRPIDMIRFEIGQAPEGLAEPLQGWYYPGKSVGLEFIVPKERPVTTAN